MQITILVEGVAQLSAKLARVISPETFRAPLLVAQNLIRERMAQYPPPRPNSTYERTGDLGMGWATPAPTLSGFGMDATIVNDVSYAPFVQGSEDQAAIHQGVWKTDVQIVDESVAQIGQDFTAAIQEALET